MYMPEVYAKVHIIACYVVVLDQCLPCAHWSSRSHVLAAGDGDETEVAPSAYIAILAELIVKKICLTYARENTGYLPIVVPLWTHMQ